MNRLPAGPADQQTAELSARMSAMAQVFAKQAQENREKEERERIDKMVEIETKVLSTMFDKAAAYTNVFIISGYAAFWGLWASTKNYVAEWQATASALLVLISVTVFVFFEVYKQQYTSKAMIGRFNLLSNPEARKSTAAYTAALNEFQAANAAHNVSFLKAWAVVSNVTIGTALGGVALLAASFVYRLLTG